uniref:Geraniol 10-hydroxylase n=1 Tax=Solanum lycopersicum TaxID=4081 RepID=A0A3Q7FC54_SOLLC
MEESGKPNLSDHFPVLKRIDPQGIRRRIGKHSDKLLQLIGGLIDERLEQRRKSPNDSRTDFLEVMLNTSEEDPHAFDRNHIEYLCLCSVMLHWVPFNFFHSYLRIIHISGPFHCGNGYNGPKMKAIEGRGRACTLLDWAMVEVMRKPYIKKKAKTDFADVIGKGKIIKEADIVRLPYLQCIVKETLRMHPPVPFLIRKVDQDVEACGYFVLEDSQVLVNVWSIGRDPATWEDPLTFKPERFWNLKMDVSGQNFELIPFGAGRRICPGLTLATAKLSTILGSLLNLFDWKAEGDIAAEFLDVEEKYGITLARLRPLRALPISL